MREVEVMWKTLLKAAFEERMGANCWVDVWRNGNVAFVVAESEQQGLFAAVAEQLKKKWQEEGLPLAENDGKTDVPESAATL